MVPSTNENEKVSDHSSSFVQLRNKPNYFQASLLNCYTDMDICGGGSSAVGETFSIPAYSLILAACSPTLSSLLSEIMSSGNIPVLVCPRYEKGLIQDAM